MRGYVVSNEKLPPLVDFLANTSLDQGESQQTTTEQSVQLMTLHAAKGLEFPLVFMIGVEEGLFPHKMCINDPQQLEEERRLCYVGMTRAMKKLHLSYAECRRLHGQEHFQRPSRFIAEIPEDLMTPVRMRYRQLAPANKPRPHQSVSKTTFKRQQNNHDQTLNLGQRVTHTQFGEGTILNCEGQGAHARVQVVFATHGVKWLMLNQAPLTFK